MIVFIFYTLSWGVTLGTKIDEVYIKENRFLAKAIVDTLQDHNFDKEILFDMKKENQMFVNRTMSLLIKYIIKREVDNYRSKRVDAISRRIYSSHIMKLIDIAKDIPRNATSRDRINTAHGLYLTVEDQALQDRLAGLQVYHACARLYDVLFTMPNILSALGNPAHLTPRTLIKKIKAMDIQPVHLGAAILMQYHLRDTINFAIRSKALQILATKPQMVGPDVLEMLNSLAAKMLPISELLDIHVLHTSAAFKDNPPSSWLNILNNRN